jgi:polar amino acid transport system substrate-binding protein
MRLYTVACGAILALILSLGPAAAGDVPPKFGDCATTGRAGSVSFVTHEPDTLTVGAVLPGPGWWNGPSPERIKDGFEYCIAAEIAHRAGVHNLKVKNMAWDQFISGAATGYDVAMASVTITEPRKQILDFSQPYFSSNLGVATKSGSDVTAENIKSKRIGVLQGNMGADWVVKTLRPKTTPGLFQSQADMITALIANQVDAVITDTALVLTATKGSNGTLSVVGQYQLDQGYGIVTPKNSPNTAAVDEVVAELKANGALKKLSADYLAPMFGGNPDRVPIWEVK